MRSEEIKFEQDMFYRIYEILKYIVNEYMYMQRMYKIIYKNIIY